MYVIVITHPLGLYLICKRDTRGCSQRQNIFKSDTNQMDVLQLLCLLCVHESKAPLACVWHVGERFYTAAPVPEWCEWLTDGKRWIYMPLCWNGFTISHADSHSLPCTPTHYKHTFDATNQLTTCIICTKHALHG